GSSAMPSAHQHRGRHRLASRHGARVRAPRAGCGDLGTWRLEGMSRDHFTNPDAAADVLEWLARARRERTPAVLATVVCVTGSAPHVPGAKLLVLADGRCA